MSHYTAFHLGHHCLLRDLLAEMNKKRNLFSLNEVGSILKVLKRTETQSSPGHIDGKSDQQVASFICMTGSAVSKPQMHMHALESYIVYCIYTKSLT